MGLATFVEDKYDTLTAKLLIYNAKWFEILFLLLVFNLIGHIIKFKLFSLQKLPALLFHLAFVIMIIGAGITRYIGYEGMMSLQEGQTSNLISTNEPYLQVRVDNSTADFPIYMGYLSNNDFTYNVNVEGKGNLKIKYKDFVPNAVENNEHKLVVGEDGQNRPDALTVEISLNGKSEEMILWGGQNYNARFQDIEIDGNKVSLAYGIKAFEIPFSLYLKDFKEEKYPGSEMASSWECEVTVIDNRNNIKEDHRIYMNHVLDYDGYRFFQSGLTADRRGTYLSVSHDKLGTWVSYFGYFLLSLGFTIAIFMRKSRFMDLRRRIAKIRADRKAGILTIALLLFISTNSFAQNGSSAIKHIDAEHADKVGHLIVQKYSGRFEPVYSFAFDVIHKITRQDKFVLENGEKLNAMQAYIDMIVHPEYWKKQNIIYVSGKPVRDKLGISEKYASYYDFFDERDQFLLNDYYNEAYRKKPVEQNAFDKEILRLVERVNIFMNTLNGHNLRIFPEQNSENNKWASWEERSAQVPLTGALQVLNDDLQLPVLNYSNMMSLYLNTVYQAAETGDYSRADKIIEYFASIQRQSPAKDIIPSETKVNVEIRYTKSQMFILLKNIYGALAMILLFLAFVENLRSKKSKIVSILLKVFTVVLIAAFLYHTYGMIVRWYLTGHAPWSNGYETLIFIAWGGILSGFIFAKNSKITLASTVLLAFFVTMTASHSFYDPQLTNLVPVLKSYWLIIHVATLTISYGFFGSGLILGIINLILGLFKNKNNYKRIGTTIKELTYINEMNLSLGIILATVGTFLGGVWANESWGRYWGWDAKETWSLIIVVSYTIVLHLRFVPKLKSLFTFNVGSILAFGTVIMTFVGVNYYLTKGQHSYGSGDTPVFPLWAWVIILSLLLLIIVSGIKQNILNKKIAKIEEK